MYLTLKVCTSTSPQGTAAVATAGALGGFSGDAPPFSLFFLPSPCWTHRVVRPIGPWFSWVVSDALAQRRSQCARNDTCHRTCTYPWENRCKLWTQVATDFDHPYPILCSDLCLSLSLYLSGIEIVLFRCQLAYANMGNSDDRTCLLSS